MLVEGIEVSESRARELLEGAILSVNAIFFLHSRYVFQSKADRLL
jgi:hypothetical protein